MIGLGNHRDDIEAQVEVTTERLLKYVREEGRLAVVQAPPGSGKTHLLLNAVIEAYRKNQRVAIATQTRSQADDICRRLVEDFDSDAIRFIGHGQSTRQLPSRVQVIAEQKKLPDTRCIVVATTAKWGLIKIETPFDVVFVEEAWQMGWADFMLLGQVAGRFVLIGDPGQIPPVVSIDASRWVTAPRAPHRPAPELILQALPNDALRLDLPATRRLPEDSARLVRPFYDFRFEAWALPGERKLVPGRKPQGTLGAVTERLQAGSVVGVTLPTPDGGPPLECDDDVAKAAVDIVRDILHCQPTWVMGDEQGELQPHEIGLCATHHVMNVAMGLNLDGRVAAVDIETPERWQGLERKVMVIVHPLSGVVQPSDFDLETGRLCVMASRHQVALVIVTRDHLAATLDAHLPSASQPVGRPDVAGRGHFQNSFLWKTLVEEDRVIELQN